MYKVSYKAARGDTLEIEYGRQRTRETVTIGAKKNPCLEYACVGKQVGDSFEYLNQKIIVRAVFPIEERAQNRTYVPKVIDCFSMPKDLESREAEKLKFGYVNDETEWKLQELEKRDKDSENLEIITGRNQLMRRSMKEGYKGENEAPAYRLFRREPYRVRLDYTNQTTGETKNIYIGLHRVEDGRSGKCHVLSWNDNFEQLRKQNSNGTFSIVNNNISFEDNCQFEYLLANRPRKIQCEGVEYELRMRREYQFGDWNEGVTYDTVYDSVENAEITDPFLRKVLEDKRRQKQVTNIVFSIQKEQHKIMYEPFEQNLMVQGCAGSGKTMILTHRISTLLSRMPNLDAEDILILTPNEMFSKSLDFLSVELEIANVGKKAIDTFYHELLLQYLPEYPVAENFEDEAETYDTDTLKKAYSEETFSEILKLENQCVQQNQNEIETAFQPIDNALKRNKIRKAQKTGSFEQYLQNTQEMVVKLETIIEKQGNAIREMEKAIENDQKRVEESKKIAQEAEYEILSKMFDALRNVEERREQCIQANYELETACEKLTLKLQKSAVARDTNGYIKENGSLNWSEIIKSGESSLIEVAQNYQDTRDEIAELESEKNRLNPNDIRKQLEIDGKILEERMKLLDFYEKIPKASDTMPITKEVETQRELEQKQREIKQNQSCIRACENCIAIIHETKGRNWPDLKQAEGCEIIADLTGEYQNARETIRVQMGRAENITTLIEESQQTLAKLREQQLSKEEREALKQLNEKLQTCTAETIIKECMQKACEMTGIKPDVKCRIQLLFLLQLCYGYFRKKIQHKIELICIDEVQDVSTLEIQLLQNVLGEKIYWNLYGDYMQVSTVYKGQPEKTGLWEPLKRQLNGSLYNIDVNYRNAKQIVEYCNKEFGMKIASTGMDGDVDSDSWSGCWNRFIECLEECKKQKDEYTAAIIVNSTSKFEMYYNELRQGGYKVNDSDLSVGTVEKKIALLDVRSAKGMEFRYVFVDKEEMTPNELYIAYTRAMEKLFVAEE